MGIITFEELERESKRMMEKNDCTVKALAVVSNMPYEYCHKHLKKHGRPDRRGPSWSQFYRAVWAMGLWKFEVTSEFDAKTTRTLNRQLPQKGRFLIDTYGHVLGARNGRIIDWSENRLKRIRNIFRIEW